MVPAAATIAEIDIEPPRPTFRQRSERIINSRSGLELDLLTIGQCGDPLFSRLKLVPAATVQWIQRKDDISTETNPFPGRF